MNRIRPAAVAGSWYPGTAPALGAAVDRHLAHADLDEVVLGGELVAIISPHAGLMYSGPVAAHAYRLVRNRSFDVAVLVGPSHFVGFDGVAIVPAGGFETPFGVAPIDAACAADLSAATRVVREPGVLADLTERGPKHAVGLLVKGVGHHAVHYPGERDQHDRQG